MKPVSLPGLLRLCVLTVLAAAALVLWDSQQEQAQSPYAYPILPFFFIMHRGPILVPLAGPGEERVQRGRGAQPPKQILPRCAFC